MPQMLKLERRKSNNFMSFAMRSLYIHRMYIRFCLPPIGQNLATMPHLAAREVERCSLHPMSPSVQLNLQFFCQEENKNINLRTAESLQQNYASCGPPFYGYVEQGQITELLVPLTPIEDRTMCEEVNSCFILTLLTCFPSPY